MNAVIQSEGVERWPLVGEIVLVTGALGGLGRAMTDALAATGARMIVHHLRQPTEAAEFVADLKTRGTEAIAVDADLTQPDEVSTMFETVEKELGSVSVLVNNAGFMERSVFVESTLEDWNRTMSVDLTGVFLCSRFAVPPMLKAGRGVIINVSSQLAFKGAHDYVSYSAAKAGVIGLTRALAREVGPTIRVNAIAPGPIDSPMTAPYATPEWVAERTQGMVMGRLGKAEEVAPAVVFLASPASTLLHGQTLHLNGGGVMA